MDKCSYCGNKLDKTLKKCDGCGSNNNYHEPIIKDSLINNKWVQNYAIKDKKTLLFILNGFDKFTVMLVFNRELETSFLTIDKSEYKPTIIFDRGTHYMKYLFDTEMFIEELFEILFEFRNYEKSLKKLNEIFINQGRYSIEYIQQKQLVDKNKITIDKCIKYYE